MTFRRFEDVSAWQTARHVAIAVYQVSDVGPFARDFGLRDQLRRAAVSMMSSIAEGSSRRSDREFVQYLFVGKGSAAEVQSHLYLAFDRSYLSQDEFSRLYDKVDHYSRQISNLILYLRRNERNPGRSYRRQTRQTQ